MRRLLLVVILLALAGFGARALLQGGSRAGPSATPTVKRGTVARKAVATGQVEPELETQVNTHLAGFVRSLQATLGQKVKAADPLCEVWPALTEADLLRAERGLANAIEGEESAKEFQRGDHLLGNFSRFLQGERNLDRMEHGAGRGRRSAEENLELLRTGKVVIGGRVVDFVVRAPVGGHVLQ